MSTPRISVTQIIFTDTRASTLKALARGFYRKNKATFWALKDNNEKLCYQSIQREKLDSKNTVENIKHLRVTFSKADTCDA